jgi:hypothetical protein
MYLLEIAYAHAPRNGTGRLEFADRDGRVPKWTVLENSAAGLERLRLTALLCLGQSRLQHLNLTGAGLEPGLRVEGIAARHAPRDCAQRSARRVWSAVGSTHGRQQRLLSHAANSLRNTPLGGRGPGVRHDLALGLGNGLQPHCGSDCFDFTGPDPRACRFGSLFDPSARVTDPAAFLALLRYRSDCGRLPPRRLLARLQEEFTQTFGVPTAEWTAPGLRARGRAHSGETWQAAWERLSPAHRAMLVPILDIVRHLLDASPHDLVPTSRQGVLLLHAPDTYVPRAHLTAWFALLDRLFPALQILVTLDPVSTGSLPADHAGARLELDPEPGPRPPRRRPARLSPDKVLLVDVDGRLPNLALMKLSTHLRSQGLHPVLVKGSAWRREEAEHVCASCVFDMPASRSRVDRLQRFYGSRLTVGGSGVDLDLRLAPEIEALPADYALYPELGDRAIGFLTRGCPGDCGFCIVPRKEGKPHRAAPLDDLLQGDARRKLILLDDNLLSHPDADALLREMAERRLQVNFNQTLDIRLVDAERARLLRRIRCSNVRFTRSNHHFSLNHARGLDQLRRRYDLFGFTPADNVQFVCMYGYDTTLAEDVERFTFLRSLPGAYVFVQEYCPIAGRPPLVSPASFWGPDPEAQIERLLQVMFSQNMKSMEVYYRWLSDRYCATFGRLHLPLVDTLFRYNRRERKGHYIAHALERTAQGSERDER